MGQIMRNLLLLFFCWSSQGRPQIGETNPQQQSIVSLQSGQQQFTNRLLKQIESNTTTNFVLSPHSIHPVFSQLLQGSGGETKAELENLLGVTASDSLVEQYRILGQGLSGEGSKQANLLAVANSFKPKREYRTSLNNGFQSDIREFDFGSNSLGSVEEINRYVEEATNEKIKDLLADDDVDGLTRMVLINAVYFKANWQFAFADRPFLFVVYDFAHEVTLFAGKVVNPNNDNVIQTRAALIQEPASPAVAAPSANSEVCSKMFRDFPNSLDNSVICNKVASEGKKLDWLRKNRALCEESKDFFDNSMSKSCGDLWCDFAAPQLADWSEEANSSGVGGCQGVEGRVESVQTKRRCKTVKNKLKAAEFLQCRN